MRLNKFLSQAGIGSRREADKLIQMATTKINGEICIDPAYNVKKKDIVNFDGKKVSPIKEKIVLMLNKPKRVITTVKDTHGRKTVMDLIPSNIRLTPIGRLDQDTTGLLLLTNDGDLQEYLTHPKNQIPKVYQAVIKGKISQLQIERLTKGVYIGNKEYGRAEVVEIKIVKGRSTILLRLKRGKKREIRRIFYRLKLNLVNLKRISISKLKLGNLEIGCYRLLTKKEINLLRN